MSPQQAPVRTAIVTPGADFAAAYKQFEEAIKTFKTTNNPANSAAAYNATARVLGSELALTNALAAEFDAAKNLSRSADVVKKNLDSYREFLQYAAKGHLPKNQNLDATKLEAVVGSMNQFRNYFRSFDEPNQTFNSAAVGNVKLVLELGNFKTKILSNDPFAGPQGLLSKDPKYLDVLLAERKGGGPQPTPQNSAQGGATSTANQSTAEILAGHATKIGGIKAMIKDLVVTAQKSPEANPTVLHDGAAKRYIALATAEKDLIKFAAEQIKNSGLVDPIDNVGLDKLLKEYEKFTPGKSYSELRNLHEGLETQKKDLFGPTSVLVVSAIGLKGDGLRKETKTVIDGLYKTVTSEGIIPAQVTQQPPPPSGAGNDSDRTRSAGASGQGQDERAQQQLDARVEAMYAVTMERGTRLAEKLTAFAATKNFKLDVVFRPVQGTDGPPALLTTTLDIDGKPRDERIGLETPNQVALSVFRYTKDLKTPGEIAQGYRRLGYDFEPNPDYPKDATKGIWVAKTGSRLKADQELYKEFSGQLLNVVKVDAVQKIKAAVPDTNDTGSGKVKRVIHVIGNLETMPTPANRTQRALTTDLFSKMSFASDVTGAAHRALAFGVAMQGKADDEVMGMYQGQVDVTPNYHPSNPNPNLDPGFGYYGTQRFGWNYNFALNGLLGFGPRPFSIRQGRSRGK